MLPFESYPSHDKGQFSKMGHPELIMSAVASFQRKKMVVLFVTMSLSQASL